MNLLNRLLNKLPLVRRLHAALEKERHAVNELIKDSVKHREFRDEMLVKMREREEYAKDQTEKLKALSQSEDYLHDGLARAKKQRDLLQRQFDDLRETVVKQAASVEVLTKARETDAHLLNEQRLTLAENKGREERWVHTIDVLNETLRKRNDELAEAREALATAQAEIAQRTRPVLFRREPGLAENELGEILAGRARDRVVVAVIQLIDECAVEAMAEAAAAPVATITEGPHAARGYSAEDRTFSAGGVFALTELRRRLDAVMEVKQAA